MKLLYLPIAHHRRRSGDQQDRTGGLGGREQARHQVLPGHFLIDEHADDDHVDAGDSAGLGGGKHAGQDAHQDDGRGQQSPDGLDELLADTLDVEFVAHRQVVFFAVIEAHDAAHQRVENAGDDAAHELLLDGDAGGHAVDDHQDAGRNDGAQHRGGGHKAGGEILGVIPVRHGLNLHGAQAGGVGQRGAGDGGEDGAGQNGHIAQAAPDMTEQGIAEVKQALGDTAGVHLIRT